MSEINDGFGDHADPSTAAVFIEAPWVRHIAAHFVRRTFGSWEIDDLAQEARIEMWRRAPRWDGRGTLEGFLRSVAENRIKSLVWDNRSLTGQEDGRARQEGRVQKRGEETRERLRTTIVDLRKALGRAPSPSEVAEAMGIHPATVRKQMKRLDRPTEVQTQTASLDALIEEYGAGAVLSEIDHLDGIVLAYHYGEIHQAVADLEPLWREYVYLRFWKGYSRDEIGRELGSTPHWAQVRLVLAERLEHLTGAV